MSTPSRAASPSTSGSPAALGARSSGTSTSSRSSSSIVASILQRALTNSQNGIITAIVGLAIILPSLAVAVRRLHDTSRSGWWLLIVIIPVVGAIILIVFWVQDSHGDNQYGPSPKAVGSTAAPA